MNILPCQNIEQKSRPVAGGKNSIWYLRCMRKENKTARKLLAVLIFKKALLRTSRQQKSDGDFRISVTFLITGKR